MDHLRAGILELSFGSDADRNAHASCIFTCQNAGRILHGDPGTDVSVDPFHGASCFDFRALCYKIQDVAGPVLHTGISCLGAFADKYFNDCGMHGIL